MDFLSRLERRLDAHPALRAFSQFITTEPSLLIEETVSAVMATLLWLAWRKEQPILVLSATSEDLLFQDLELFCAHHLLEFPALDALPGDVVPPSADLIGLRTNALVHLLEHKEPCIVLAPLQAALHKLPAPTLFGQECPKWRQGKSVAFEGIEEHLRALGYARKTLVEDKGEFALRGGIVDLFPVQSPHPFRVEFMGDVIEEIRIFDPASQKTVGKASEVPLAPLRESPGTHTLLDYFASKPLLFFNDIAKIEDRYVELKSRLPEAHFFSLQSFLARAEESPKHFFLSQRVEALSSVRMEQRVGRAYYTGESPLQPLRFHCFDTEFATARWEHPFHPLQDLFGAGENRAALTLSHVLDALHAFPDAEILSPSEKECTSLRARYTQEHIHISRHSFSGSYALDNPPFALVSTADLGQHLRPRRQKWRSAPHQSFAEFHPFSPGDLVVHFQHGIAKFTQMERKTNHLGTLEDFLELEFANGSKLYVPLAQSYLVSRYVGTHEEAPILSELGTKRWQHALMRAQRSVEGYAQQLLKMHAERTLAGGIAFPPDSEAMQFFEADFPFTETEDQLQAIAAVKSDMERPIPMDRLICGDVGYGKTEVAIRAAFKACYEGKKQVAFLVPTTLLAMQHYETCTERMANFPVRVELLSRIKSPRAQKAILEDLAQGNIDIVVGTHRLVSKDVHFKDLGLVVIDEEQRFGVRAKERLKHLKAGVDCLTLSATPIPRTLYLALMGSREISTIYTPPQDRLPIKTLVVPRTEEIPCNAIERELSRGGQAFFVHNRVESIYSVAEELQKLLPQARIAIAHGQMDPVEVDDIFHSFKEGQADVLVATTLIENGVDVPNANTILIDRAHTFGLADLYQMRGRVGRWNRPAFAYFLTPQRATLSDISRMRLDALASATGLGAGMKVAMRDLEIRGAGDILGVQQSGQISSIGFHLYCKLLKRTMQALQQKKAPEWMETKMEYTFKAALPEEYIPETTLRMELYHRLGNASALDEIDAISAEIRDRFGPLPEPALWLVHLMRLKVFASMHHFSWLKCDKTHIAAKRRNVHKLFALPHVHGPQEWEECVASQLKNNFALH